MASRLQKQFAFVRGTFFPRWDREDEWKVRVVPNDEGCWCLRELRTIKIASEFLKDRQQELPVVLIHEVAHAVTTDSHGKRWVARMKAAVKTAESAGHPRLAADLGEHINFCLSGYDVSMMEVYDRIQQAVCDQPSARFDDVLDWVRGDYRMSRSQFLKTFPQVRVVYEEAFSCVSVRASHRRPQEAL